MPDHDDHGTADANDVREAALRLLARREHAGRELREKLVRKGWPVGIVETIVATLGAEGLQSDERFAESFVRQRVERCYGPRRILAELSVRGIDSADAHTAIENADVDFEVLAARYASRKWQTPATDFRERARRAQALTRRGFETAHVRSLFNDA